MAVVIPIGWTVGTPTMRQGQGKLRLPPEPASSNVALGLVRFNLSYAVPVNATITSASLQLTTQTTTNLSSGTYVFGVHQVIPPPAGQVPWNDASTWNVVVAPYGWNGGASSPITAGVDFNSNLMDAVTVTSTQVNSNQVLLAWNITPSLAQVWVNPSNNNYGILNFAGARDERDAFGIYFLLGQHRKQPAEAQDAGHLHHSMRRNYVPIFKENINIGDAWYSLNRVWAFAKPKPTTTPTPTPSTHFDPQASLGSATPCGQRLQGPQRDRRGPLRE